MGISIVFMNGERLDNVTDKVLREYQMKQFGTFSTGQVIDGKRRDYSVQSVWYFEQTVTPVAFNVPNEPTAEQKNKVAEKPPEPVEKKDPDVLKYEMLQRRDPKKAKEFAERFNIEVAKPEGQESTETKRRPGRPATKPKDGAEGSDK